MSLAGLSLRDLEYLVAVSDARHFGRAAAACGVSQPALSAQVRKLEAFLGVTVFERLPGRVLVTERGHAILDAARSVLERAEALVAVAHAGAAPLAGPFRLAAIPTLGPYILPTALRALRAEFPAMELVVSEGRTAELLSDLREGKLDGALACLPEDDPAFVAHPLFFEPFMLIHQAGATCCWPIESDDGRLILLEEGHCLRDQARALCGVPAGSSERPAMGLEMLRHMVAAGEGTSLVPALATAALGDMGGAVAYTRIGDPGVGRDIALVVRRSDPREADLLALAALLRQLAPSSMGAG